MSVHEFKFSERGKIIDHGKVVVSGDVNLAPSLMILRMSKFSVDYPHFVKRSAQSIVLQTPEEYDQGGKNKKLRARWRDTYGNEDYPAEIAIKEVQHCPKGTKPKPRQ